MAADRLGTTPGHEDCWHCEHCGRPVHLECALPGQECSTTECPGWDN